VMSMMELTHRNTRRYGGYIVHIGIVVIFVGITGSAFKIEQKGKELSLGQSTQVGRYTLKVAALAVGANPNYRWWRLDLGVSKDGEDLGVMHPERRFYINKKQADTEVAIRHRLNEDLYVNFRTDEDNDKLVILDSYVNPLTTWVWMGYFVILFGTLICLTPPKTRMVWPRMEVVGIEGKRAKVEE
jgi:cytochrome c-type biogenesis protein CcmF